MEQIIKLSKLNEEGVIIESSKEFEISAFSSVYQKVKLLLNKIITQKNKEENLQGDINNIISFEGRRGTGKTSAMMSIHKALENYGKEPFLNLEEGLDSKVLFVTLNYIDASLLENEESIIELILANMFSKLLEHDRNGNLQNQNEYASKEVYRLFEKVYSSFTALNSQTKKYGEISPLRVLNELSSSQLLGENIKELVDHYLIYMDNEKKINRFLVISVDDIDMNLNTGKGKSQSVYEMLENLHRYFMIPNVILMLTYDYSNLCIACEKHFYKIYPLKWESKTKLNSQYVKSITAEYLKKIVPIYNRVYMPSLQKKDYFNYNIIKIRMNTEEIQCNLNLFKKTLCKNQKNTTIDLTIKKFSFLMKASACDLYYDVLCIKNHFAEPASLREMVQSYRFFRYLLKNEDSIMFKNLLDDLYFRFATENLDRRELNIFKHYLDLTIEKRSQNILNDLETTFNKKHNKKRNHNTRFSAITYIGEKKSSYSYGELLFGLYQASKNGWFSKKFICCILNSYTIMLTKLYRKMKTINDSKEIKPFRNEFAQIIGTSIAGSWSNLFLPKLQRVEEPVLEAEMDEANENQIIIDPQDTSLISAASIKHTLSMVQLFFKLTRDATLTFDKFKKEFHLIEIMGMFFTNISHRGSNTKINEGFEISYISGESLKNQGDITFTDFKINNNVKSEEQRGNTKENTIEYTSDICFEYTDGCFNIMNFVTNLFLWDDYFDSLHQKLLKAYEDYYQDIRNLGNQNIKIKDMKNFFKTHSLKAKYVKWYNDFKGFAMPLYSFDMMYNIMKLCYQNRGLLPAAVTREFFWDYVKKVYVNIGNLLKEEGEFYFSDAEGKPTQNRDNCFWQAYQECPFIDYLNKLDEDNFSKEKFKNYFKEMIFRCCNQEEIRK